MSTQELIASKIRILREVHNYTQEHVANVLDISQNTYSLIEKGETKLTVDRLERLANLYQMELIDLFRMNEHTYIHTITHSNGIIGTQQLTVNQTPEEERKLYIDTISRLERENDKLHKLIEKLTEKM